jgi:hypothetical protein
MVSLLLGVLAALGAARPPAVAAQDNFRPPAWEQFPTLVTLLIENGVVRARTGPDSSGQVQVVAFDAEEKSWSRPVRETLPAARSEHPRLDQVLVFNGGLFDQFSSASEIDLGEGYVLAKRDTGYALIDQGIDRGWPTVSVYDLPKWGREVRLGLPRDFPEDQLEALHAQGRLRNVPGPFARVGDKLWFGLAGGFAAGEGQLGGLLAWDTAKKQFEVVRHKFIIDVAVTRLLALGDELWLGTGRFAPTNLEGLRGMLLYRPARREWRQFAPDNSRIAGDLVYDMAASGRQLWATTNLGISRYDLDRRLWSSWYWQRTDDGGFELTSERPVDLSDRFHGEFR